MRDADSTASDQAAVGASVAPGAVTELLRELANAPAPREPAVALAPGERVGRFEILRELGRGGFGVVYEARDTLLPRLVALKLLSIRRAPDPDDAPLVEEAEAAAHLQHPNVVSLFDVGSYAARPYLVMELLHGESLASRLARGPLPPSEALRVAIAVARGIAHAHAHGVVHRDLKPANVFLPDDGSVKLLDFGLAHLAGASFRSAGGTPGYMAPEQQRGGVEDERVDVYALGRLVVEMITGVLPTATGQGIGRGERAALAPGRRLPPGLASALERMLAADVRDRLRDGAAALDALLQVERSAAVRRSRARLAAAAAVAATVVAAAAWYVANRPPAQPVVVAIADAVNETADAELDAVTGLLVASLEQSAHVRVVPRSRMVEVLRAAERGNVERLDEALGRDAAMRTHAGALLVPTVRRFGEAYALALAAVDPKEGDRLFAVTVDGHGRSAIPRLVDELAQAGLRRVAGRLAPSPQPVSATVTANLAASHRYFKGRNLEDQHRYDEAMVEYRQAIEADPGFVLARVAAARAGWLIDMPEEDRKALLAPLLPHLGALRPRERELVRGMQEELAGDRDAAIARYQRLAEVHPEDREPPYLIGELLFHGGRFDEAVPWYERALEIDPAWPLPLTHVVMRLPPEQALERARIATRLFPGSGNHWALAIALQRSGDKAGAADAARRMAQIAGTPLVRAYAVAMLVSAEQLEEADAEARAIYGVAPRDAFGPAHMAIVLTCQGKVREALDVVPAARGTYAAHAVVRAALNDRSGAEAAALPVFEHAEGGGEVPAFIFAEMAAAFIEVNAPEAAERAVSFLGEHRAASALRAAVAWRRGKTDEALAVLRSEPAATPYGAYFRGAICAATGRDEEAIEALRGFDAPEGESVWTSWAFPRALFLRARSHERLGQRDEALAAIERLLALWRRADPDLPLLAEAKALRARVAASGSD